jgi:hypothetical protein
MTTTTKSNKQKPKTEIKALANYLECKTDDLSEETYSHYGLKVFSNGREQYAVGTDSEADEACLEYIKDTAWAFRSSFICSYCNLPQELAEALETMQSKKCEGANDAILALIENTDSGIHRFVEEAISADGRGHFLSGYDGKEIELNGFYAYRIN